MGCNRLYSSLTKACSFSVLKYWKTCLTTRMVLFDAICQYIPKEILTLTHTQNAFHVSPIMPKFRRQCLLQRISLGSLYKQPPLPTLSFIRYYSENSQNQTWDSKAGSPSPNSSSNRVQERNQQMELYRKIVDAFPEGIQMAFAYGSGAFQQSSSQAAARNMLDFIFVVDKPRRWHRLNLQKHPSHYSFLRWFGPHRIMRIQDLYGAGTYFNTLIPMEGRMIKYGVISTPRLITDLLDWETLYISGRLHKPVSLVITPTNEHLLTAMKMNLWSAVHAALLLLPDMFTEEQFYYTVANLSYAGDFRMTFAENTSKISNIVKPALPLFRRMYGPLLLEEQHVTWWQAEGQLEQALTYHSRHHHLKCLPGQVLYGLLLQKYQYGVFPDLEEIIKRLAYDSECGKHVASSIRHIVKRSSMSQSLKGILTAGLVKSIRYSGRKIMKKLKS